LAVILVPWALSVKLADLMMAEGISVSEKTLLRMETVR
jgi:hypothetical protein